MAKRGGDFTARPCVIQCGDTTTMAFGRGNAVPRSERNLRAARPEIGSVADLKGKIVGVTQPLSSSDFVTRLILKRNGLEYNKDVQVLTVGTTTAQAASFEAKDRGARTAILMDADNCVAEGPGFNVVIVKDGKLASPSRNALPGITRKTVFELADTMGIEATLRDVTSHELYDADELMAVTTLSIAELISISPEGADELAMQMLIENMKWAMNENWLRDFFGEAKPVLERHGSYANGDCGGWAVCGETRAGARLASEAAKRFAERGVGWFRC